MTTATADHLAGAFLVAVAVVIAVPWLLIRALVWIEARDRRRDAEDAETWGPLATYGPLDDWDQHVDDAVALTCAEPIYAELAIQRLRDDLDKWGAA